MTIEQVMHVRLICAVKFYLLTYLLNSHIHLPVGLTMKLKLACDLTITALVVERRKLINANLKYVLNC